MLNVLKRDQYKKSRVYVAITSRRKFQLRKDTKPIKQAQRWNDNCRLLPKRILLENTVIIMYNNKDGQI